MRVQGMVMGIPQSTVGCPSGPSCAVSMTTVNSGRPNRFVAAPRERVKRSHSAALAVCSWAAAVFSLLLFWSESPQSERLLSGLLLAGGVGFAAGRVVELAPLVVRASNARARRWSCFSPESVGVVDGVLVANIAAIAASSRPWMRAPDSGSKVPERRHMPDARSVQVRRRVARRWRSNRLIPPSAAIRSAVAWRLAANSSGVDPDEAAVRMSPGPASVSPVLTSPSRVARTLVNTSTWSPLNSPVSSASLSEGESASASARANTLVP